MKRLQYLAAIIFFFHCLFFGSSRLWAVDIYVFNPESRANLSQTAKKSLQQYFQNHGHRVQVFFFAREQDFLRMYRQYQPEYCIVASYVDTAYKNKLQWQTVLQGHNKTSTNFQKILVTNKNIRSLADLKKKGIATVVINSPVYVQRYILNPLNFQMQDLRLVSVSKDIDAIMALGFGQVAAAIVTQNSFDLLRRINPGIVSSLKIFRRLRPMNYPKLVLNKSKPADNKIILLFQQMSKDSQISPFLNFLQITGFRP